MSYDLIKIAKIAHFSRENEIIYDNS